MLTSKKNLKEDEQMRFDYKEQKGAIPLTIELNWVKLAHTELYAVCSHCAQMWMCECL